jgi:hypothetical protein
MFFLPTPLPESGRSPYLSVLVRAPPVWSALYLKSAFVLILKFLDFCKRKSTCPVRSRTQIQTAIIAVLPSSIILGPHLHGRDLDKAIPKQIPTAIGNRTLETDAEMIGFFQSFPKMERACWCNFALAHARTRPLQSS